MEKTNTPTLVGILNIVSGVIGLVFAAGMIALSWFFMSMMYFPTEPTHEFPPMIHIFQAIYLGWGIILAIVSILALVGGVYALQRKIWGLALAGSIAAIVAFFPMGIPAVIFVAQSRNEFEQAQ